MRIKNLFKKSKNVINENGLNLIYNQNGKGDFLIEKYTKKNGLIDGDYEKYSYHMSHLNNSYSTENDRHIYLTSFRDTQVYKLYQNGKIIKEIHFNSPETPLKNNGNGLYRRYSITGLLLIEISYLNGIKTLVKEYSYLNEIKTLFKEYSYLNGIKTLLKKYSYNDGKITTSVTYISSCEMIEEHFDKNEKVIERIKYIDDKIVFAKFYNNGVLIREKNYNNGQLIAEDGNTVDGSYYLNREILIKNLGNIILNQDNSDLGEFNGLIDRIDCFNLYNDDGVKLNKEEIFFQLNHKKDLEKIEKIMAKQDNSHLNFNYGTRQKSSKISLSSKMNLLSDKSWKLYLNIKEKKFKEHFGDKYQKETFSLVVVNNFCFVKREVYKIISEEQINNQHFFASLREIEELQSIIDSNPDSVSKTSVYHEMKRIEAHNKLVQESKYKIDNLITFLEGLINYKNCTYHIEKISCENFNGTLNSSIYIDSELTTKQVNKEIPKFIDSDILSDGQIKINETIFNLSSAEMTVYNYAVEAKMVISMNINSNSVEIAKTNLSKAKEWLSIHKPEILNAIQKSK